MRAAPPAHGEVAAEPLIVQAPPWSADPRPPETTRSNVSTANVVGGGGAVTEIVCVVVAVAPSSSVTSRVIVYVPDAA